MARTIIGIAGLARSGKDSLAAALLADGTVDTKRSFAAPLKAAVNDIYGWNSRHAEGDLKETIIPAHASLGRITDVLYSHFSGKGYGMVDTDSFELAERWLGICQSKGALVNRNGQPSMGGIYTFRLSPRQAYQWFGTDLMRNNVSPNIWLDLAFTGNDNIVIPDVRFENEAAAVRGAGGLLIHVSREGIGGLVASHVSEAGVAARVGDVTLSNDGTLADLQYAGRYIVARYKLGDLPDLVLTPTHYSARQLATHYGYAAVVDKRAAV